MQAKRFSLHFIALSIVAVLALTLLAAALWLAPVRSAQAVSSAPILSSSYDVWQAGSLTVAKGWGVYPEVSSDVDGKVYLFDDSPYTSTMGLVGAAPLTATVATARIMVSRGESSNAEGDLVLAVCEGKEIGREISAVNIDLADSPVLVWNDIALVETTDELTLAPSESLCWIATKTSAGNLDLSLVLQAAVRYWSPPTDQLFLPAVSH